MTVRYSTGARNAMLGTTGLSTGLANFIIDLYSGTQPADSDSAETGTQLLRITLDGGAFTSGVSTNGLNFDTVASGAIAIPAADTWKGDGIAAGTAGWFRVYANTVVTGASTTSVRIDGSVGTSGADMNLGNTTIAIGATTTLDQFTLTQPVS